MAFVKEMLELYIKYDPTATKIECNPNIAVTKAWFGAVLIDLTSNKLAM